MTLEFVWNKAEEDQDRDALTKELSIHSRVMEKLGWNKEEVGGLSANKFFKYIISFNP